MVFKYQFVMGDDNMTKLKTQEERLNYLVDKFKEDSGEYRNLRVSDNINEKKRILRSLMNIRMPRKMDDETLAIQDEYLKEAIIEKGIVEIKDIKTVSEEYGSDKNYADMISIWQGDITRLSVDAIVNAANSQMLGCFQPCHTCIDNCIHTFGGIQMRAECNEKMNNLRLKYGMEYEQPTAVPMLTDGYNLPAKKVIHIVGPIVMGRLTKELEKDLSDCYKNTLDMCLENGLKSVAFCCISTGVFHFPNERAAEIAVDTVTKWLSEHEGSMERVIFNVFKDEDKFYYEGLLS